MNEILDHVDINPRKLGHGRGSAPYRRSDWTSRLWAMSKNRTVKNDVPVCARSLSWLSWISELSGTPLATAPSNARRSAGLSPWKPTIYEVQDRAKAVTSQSNAWKPTCEDEQSFPEEARTDHVTPEMKDRTNTLNSRGKRNQTSSLLQQQKASITN